MDPKAAKESIVSRLFGFGKKKAPEPEPSKEEPFAATAEERGFAVTEAARSDGGLDDDSVGAEGPDDGDEPRITVPEQVIRIRTGGFRKRDEVVGAIGESFKELTSLLGSVSDRLDRQDARAEDLSEQLREIPEYLRQLPELAAEQNQIARQNAESLGLAAQSLAQIPVTQREQTEAIRGVAEVVAGIPEEMRARSQAQQKAMEALAEAQQQTARVIHHGNQKQLGIFHQATQKTLQTVHQSVKQQRREMEQILRLSEQNMKRMLILTAGFVVAALVSVVAVLWLR